MKSHGTSKNISDKGGATLLVQDMKAYRFSKEELYFMKRLQSYGSTYDFDRWPEVYWGKPPESDRDENCEIPINLYDSDYLGMYLYSINEEGHIELFEERIKNCARSISNDLDLSVEAVFRDLCFIVLMHELGHWLTHWCHKEEFAHRRQNFLDQPEEVVETLAKLTFLWATIRLSNRSVHQKKRIFFHLVDKQSYPYRQVLAFESFYTKKGTILRRYNDLLDQKEWGLQYLLDGKKHKELDRKAKNSLMK